MNHSPDKPAVGGWDGIADPPPGRWCAAALLFTPDGRYLMQLRDDLARINFPDHWACFGGTIEPGETPEVAMRRELREELGFAAEAVSAFTEQRLVMPFPQPRLERLTFFAVPIAPEAVDGMVLMEGAAMTLFTPEQLALKARVAPWDLAAVIMHARRTALFRPAVAPVGRSD